MRFDRAMTPSIVVAVVTNRPDLLERHALGGVGESTKAGIAALIVDQSPEGGAEALARSAGAGYLRSGQGLSLGRNLAVRSTDADVVAFVDDDVEFDATWAERVAELFGQVEGAGVVAGRGLDHDGRLWPGTAEGTYGWPTNPFGLGSGFNLAFRRAALAEAGPFDERLGGGAMYRTAEDTDMVYRIMRAGWTVVCSDDITVTHHNWRSWREEMRAHFDYGYGAGAQTARHVADGDAEAGRVAARETRKHVATIVRATVTLRPHALVLQPPFLLGMGLGFLRRRRALACGEEVLSVDHALIKRNER